MGRQTTGTIRRAVRVGIVAALATSLLASAPPGAHADFPTVKAIGGGGVVHGITRFYNDLVGNTGLPSTCTEGGAGDHVYFDVDGWAPNFSYSTVIVGFVGVVHITGSGYSECTTGLTREGSLNLSITGTGPTGSQIDCGPLTGGFQRIGTAVSVEISGPCTINDWATSEVTFASALQFTPFDPVGSGVDSTKNIERAYFDGAFSLLPIIDIG